MIRKMIRVVFIAVLLLLVSASVVSGDVLPPPIMDASTASLPDGELVHMFGLEDGSTAYVEIRHTTAGDTLGLAIFTPPNYRSYWDFSLTGNEQPEKIIVSVCGDSVHAIANWSDGEMQQFRWQLGVQIPANMWVSKVYLPSAAAGGFEAYP